MRCVDDTCYDIMRLAYEYQEDFRANGFAWNCLMHVVFLIPSWFVFIVVWSYPPVFQKMLWINAVTYGVAYVLLRVSLLALWDIMDGFNNTARRKSTRDAGGIPLAYGNADIPVVLIIFGSLLAGVLYLGISQFVDVASTIAWIDPNAIGYYPPKNYYPPKPLVQPFKY